MSDSPQNPIAHDELRSALYSSLNALNLLVEFGLTSQNRTQLEYCAFFHEKNQAMKVESQVSVDEEFVVAECDDLLPQLILAEQELLQDQFLTFKRSAKPNGIQIHINVICCVPPWPWPMVWGAC